MNRPTHCTAERSINTGPFLCGGRMTACASGVKMGGHAADMFIPVMLMPARLPHPCANTHARTYARTYAHTHLQASTPLHTHTHTHTHTSETGVDLPTNIWELSGWHPAILYLRTETVSATHCVCVCACVSVCVYVYVCVRAFII